MFSKIMDKLKTYGDIFFGIIALIVVLSIGIVGFFLVLTFTVVVILSIIVLVIINKLFNNDKHHSKDIQL